MILLLLLLVLVGLAGIVKGVAILSTGFRRRIAVARSVRQGATLLLSMYVATTLAASPRHLAEPTHPKMFLKFILPSELSSWCSKRKKARLKLKVAFAG